MFAITMLSAMLLVTAIMLLNLAMLPVYAGPSRPRVGTASLVFSDLQAYLRKEAAPFGAALCCSRAARPAALAPIKAR